MSREYWLVVRQDGTLLLHAENDGWAFIRRGPETYEAVVSRDELRNSYPWLFEALERSAGQDTPRVIYAR